MSTLSSTLAGPTASLPRSLFGYEVLDYVGRGAGSHIYVVAQPGSGQLYALKHVVPAGEKDERFVEQLENEYEVGHRVACDGLRRTVDLKVKRTLLRKTVEAALVMELVDGSPLDVALPAELPDVLECFIQTGSALLALHRLGYVHCDLKPNNILLSPAGRVKVIDLGQAAKTGTVKTRIQGTPDYIAPEQVKCREVTGRTDVYNLGATLYWALAGRNVPTLYTVSKGENSFLVDSEIPSPHQLNRRVPQTLSNLVMECVRVSPGKRPEMAECVRRLEVIQFAARRDAGRRAV